MKNTNESLQKHMPDKLTRQILPASPPSITLQSGEEDGRNRVGGKRSSFLPTFVFRPLTPPYVPFGIRRFLSADAI